MFDVKEVTEGVAKFEFVEPSNHGSPTRASTSGIGLLEGFGQCLDYGTCFDLFWLQFLRRRHFAPVELIKNSLPGFDGFNVFQLMVESVESKIPFLDFGAMAAEAVLLQKWLDRLKLRAMQR